jgi:pilus assembly protein CpaD
MLNCNALRTASLLVVMFLASCATPPEHPAKFEDGAANHPITVEPSYRSLKLGYAGALSPEDSTKLTDFVGDYLEHGNGAISISAPAGSGASQTITALGEQLAGMGVPRSRILVGVDEQAATDGRVEIGYVTYVAHTDPCGDWSVNAADTSENLPMPNFGCSVQQNIAAQIADPRDLVESRGLGPADATRRMSVLGKYEQAQSTSATKTKDQSGAVSEVGSSSQQ